MNHIIRLKPIGMRSVRPCRSTRERDIDRYESDRLLLAVPMTRSQRADARRYRSTQERDIDRYTGERYGPRVANRFNRASRFVLSKPATMNRSIRLWFIVSFSLTRQLGQNQLKLIG